MANITFSDGQGLDFTNLVFALTGARVLDARTFVLDVAQPLEGFSGDGQIVVAGEYYAQNGSADGRIQEIDFIVRPSRGGETVGLRIDGLSADLGNFLVALDIPDAAKRFDRLTDLIFGADDVIEGGAGADGVYGLKGNDLISAGRGNDLIYAGTGSDTIDGGGESARRFGTFVDPVAGTDNAAGDLVYYLTHKEGVDVDLKRGTAIEANGSVDRLTDIEGAGGGKGDDTLKGDAGDNLFVTQRGSDVVDGRGGFDVVNYGFDAGRNGGLVADLRKGRVVESNGDVDRLKSVEGVFGGALNDTISGDDGDNVLCGVYGEDVLRGRGGADSFLFNAPGGTAVIKDFAPGEDRLTFVRDQFGLKGDAKIVVSDDPSARGRGATFLFDSDDHILWLDRDGSGKADPSRIATLEGVTSITLADIELI